MRGYCKRDQDCCGIDKCIPKGKTCCWYYFCEWGQTCCGAMGCCRKGYICKKGQCHRDK